MIHLTHLFRDPEDSLRPKASDFCFENGMEKEGEIYALLESHRMSNIAPFGREIW